MLPDGAIIDVNNRIDRSPSVMDKAVAIRKMLLSLDLNVEYAPFPRISVFLSSRSDSLTQHQLLTDYARLVDDMKGWVSQSGIAATANTTPKELGHPSVFRSTQKRPPLASWGEVASNPTSHPSQHNPVKKTHTEEDEKPDHSRSPFRTAANVIMDCKSQVLWDDIAGLEFQKKALQEVVILPMLRP
ncbi:Fidgetin like-1 [Fasciola hepatica]|uniref:Fidgetin like-1 n=1 Tax=Fasciola hepatica TaxID=6192 RepID=A0A4E0RTU6_FASHE|nr:Fidgetin like-1 [Fasciola hepatica]